MWQGGFLFILARKCHGNPNFCRARRFYKAQTIVHWGRQQEKERQVKKKQEKENQEMENQVKKKQ